MIAWTEIQKKKERRETYTNYDAPKVQCTLIVCQDVSGVGVPPVWDHNEIDLALDLIPSPECKHR